mmetsp:Transcript_58551/g.143228  ORF Transcript_58551/g.143228 Transcript_58551/m.143228 type:complete len:524 (+) Transcript_58551:171-1742(+)
MMQQLRSFISPWIFLVICCSLDHQSSTAMAEAGTTSKLQVQIPQDLRRDGGYAHREALFGLPPYGGSIEQNVYYADAKMCDTNDDYSRGGYPTRDNDESGSMAPWKAPFILMVDRGDCTFVKKVRNAQKLGAAGVIIADNTCLCNAGSECKTEDGSCETKEPIMADDGSGADITIPSFLMYKQDADPVKEVLKKNTIVRMQMSWALPRPDSRVEYELWTTPKDDVSRPLQRNFREVAKALGEHAQFTPHMYVYDGLFAGCQGSDGENQCYNLCTNDGRYCATDPDDDLDSGISGADVVRESLRRLCIWKEYGKDGIGVPWWEYVDEFLYRCDTNDFFTNDDCIKDAMKRASIDFSKIKICMDDSGGLEGDVENTLLEAELNSREAAGVVILPSFFVNNAPLRGALTSGEVFEAICAGYAAGSEPDVCNKCNSCDNTVKCAEIGHCPGAVDSLDTVSVPVFAATLLGVVAFFSCLGVIQWQRAQRQMRSQVRGIVAEYMPVDANSKVETLGIPDDDDEYGVELS